MKIPNFVLKNQKHLLSSPQGDEVENGVVWIFDSPKGEISVTQFDGTFGREWILSYPTDEHPSEVYGEDYDPMIHGDESYTNETTEEERDIDEALQTLFGGISDSLNFVELFPNLKISRKESDWLLEVPNSEVYFLARECPEGYNLVFVGNDETEQGGPFDESNRIRQFVYGILQTLQQENHVKQSEKPKIEENKSNSQNLRLWQSANEKIASACSDIDQTGQYKISDVLAMAMEAIVALIEGEE